MLDFFLKTTKIYKMGLHKGKTNNPNGRPKGKPNKSTEELREIVQAFIENNLENLQVNFDLLEPKEKLMFLDKMLKMVLPQPLNDLEKLTDEQLQELINKIRNE